MNTEDILQQMKEINDRLGRIEARLASSASAAPAGAAADDRDLDSQYGNPEVRKDPKRWIEDGGASFVGRTFSDCSPEYLDAIAGLKEWQAQKDLEGGDPAKQKYVGYARKDAARARGWAARLRSGWKAPAFGGGKRDANPSPYGTSGHGANAKHTMPADGFSDDDAPF